MRNLLKANAVILALQVIMGVFAIKFLRQDLNEALYSIIIATAGVSFVSIFYGVAEKLFTTISFSMVMGAVIAVSLGELETVTMFMWLAGSALAATACLDDATISINEREERKDLNLFSLMLAILPMGVGLLWGGVRYGYLFIKRKRTHTTVACN